jgi:hypothetical protein
MMKLTKRCEKPTSNKEITKVKKKMQKKKKRKKRRSNE